jgi:hypothetical protein
VTSLVTDKAIINNMPNADWWEGLPPLERTRRAKVEFVWRMWKHGTRRMECEIAAIDGVGFEARIIDNGELYFSRVFPTRELAMQEADWKKRQLLGAGWLERLPMPD